ncbi:MAG: exodeoxyribonuclease VII large subunit [Vicinamibacteria bacterium]
MADEPAKLDLGLDLTAADPDLPGPFTVGAWANGFRDFVRKRPRVLVIGEVFNLKRARASTYFELRDSDGAAPCAIWNNDLDRLQLPEGAFKDGAEVVIGGGPDYYPGSQTASPSFSFRATYVRLAGEGDLLAQLDRSRRRLDSDGLLVKQRALPRPALPRTIGVVTARNSAACADLLAGLERRGWRGTIVWADAPVQDRRAAGAIGAALRGLAEIEQVEVAVVCRGGGSLTDLWAFCDENLCRTVAMLRLPVISAVGHEVDRTLIDDVAAVSCSTPTHAAEALVRVDVNAARTQLRATAIVAGRAGTEAVARRAQRLAECSRAPTRALRHERGRLHQMLREIRASASRRSGERVQLARTHALVVKRKADSFPAARSAALKRIDALSSALSAHDPERTLARGYALVADREGAPVTSAATARERGDVVVRFADDAVGARIDPEPQRDGSDEHT